VRDHERENCLAVYERISVGNTEIDGGRVVRFDKMAPTLPYIDAGFSLMQSNVIDLLPRLGACSFEQMVYSRLAERGALACEVVDHDFYDIGTPEELARTRAALESIR
jgi:NDP-sugar pyrophosphorylase family protein